MSDMTRRSRAWIHKGDIYFSPNSLRVLSGPPIHGERAYVPVVFSPGSTKAQELQQPHWWKPKSEWQSCIPLLPVPYQGYWFSALSPSPDEIVFSPENGSFMLERRRLGCWVKAENLLNDVSHILWKRNGFDYSIPYEPRCWNYDKMYPTKELAEYHINCARDWFSVWIGLLYWMTKKVPESSSFIPGFSAPRWYMQVVQGTEDGPVAYDVLRGMPMLSETWGWSRVGVWLHLPSDEPSQPKAQWFVDRGIPVWYRWGGREVGDCARDPYFKLISPSPTDLQNATTFMTATLSYSAPNPSQIQFEDFGVGAAADGIFSRLDEVSLGPIDPINLTHEADAARKAWDEFWAKREEVNKRKLEKETLENRQRRENRQRIPPVKTAEVYVWNWNDDTPRRFVPVRVPKSNREEELEEHSNDDCRTRYDAFDNEWHCASGLEGKIFADAGSDMEDESPQSAPPRDIIPQPAVVPLLLMDARLERTKKYVLNLLSQWFGFVPPIPLPDTVARYPTDEEGFILTLAIDKEQFSRDFFTTPLGACCIAFLKRFFDKDTPHAPEDGVWDLAEENRQTLKFSSRLSAIKIIRTEEGELWYMFDFESSRTVPWNLAVKSAAAALYICRLDESMSEWDVALELAQEGIPFHTLQSRETLIRAPRNQITDIYIPVRKAKHVFGTKDHDLFRHQSKIILSHPRARAAIMRGGFSRRVAIEYISVMEAVKGPSGLYDDPTHMFLAKDRSGHEYIDDNLNDTEFEALCGLYLTYTVSGGQIAKRSWYPLPYGFQGSGEDVSRWTDRLEVLWNRSNKAILAQTPPEKHLNLPLNLKTWRDSHLKGYSPTRRAWKRVEEYSRKFIKDNVGEL